MNQKKHWGKHMLTIMILGVLAFLAAGSSIRDHAKKGMKAYKAGDYEKAKKLWEKSSHITDPDYYTYAEACWFLGEIYYDEGNEEKALEYKIKAYNYLLEDDFRIKEAKKMESGVYDKMMSDPQIRKKLAQQEKERKERAAAEAKKQFVGTWSFYTINKDGKSYSKSNLIRYPQQVVFKENGTGYVNTPTYPDGADDHSNFTWSYQNGELTTSLTAMRVGMNEEGYVWCNSSAITKNMGLERVFVFFKKN